MFNFSHYYRTDTRYCAIASMGDSINDIGINDIGDNKLLDCVLTLTELRSPAVQNFVPILAA